jgi:hypothetical protein
MLVIGSVLTVRPLDLDLHLSSLASRSQCSAIITVGGGVPTMMNYKHWCTPRSEILAAPVSVPLAEDERNNSRGTHLTIGLRHNRSQQLAPSVRFAQPRLVPPPSTHTSLHTITVRKAAVS